MKEKVSIISVFVNAALSSSKIAVGFFVRSTSVLADGFHSLMDVFSSAISFAGIKISNRPIDEKHPYGYYKFEVLSGLLITLILLGTGIEIIYESYKKFVNPSQIGISAIAFLIMLVSAAANEVMARLKIHYGKKENSVSLLSDGFHSRIDAYSSAAVFGGLIVSRYWVYADPLLALLIGIYIIKESLPIGKEAVDSLLDVSAGEETENKIKSIVKSQNISLISLKTQKKGGSITANLEIKLPENLTVKEAENISNNLKNKMLEEIKNLQYVAIQIKSHDTSTLFYKPLFGRGFGWQRRGRFRDVIEKAQGKGPEGYCICPKCGYKVKHQRGIPCSTIKCPNCGSSLERD